MSSKMRVGDHMGLGKARAGADATADVGAMLVAGVGAVELEQRYVLDGLLVRHDGAKILTEDDGHITTLAGSGEKYALRLEGDGCTLDLRASGLNVPTLIENVGRGNTISLAAGGMGPAGGAFVVDGARADFSYYKKLRLYDVPRGAKAFRVNGPDGGVKQSIRCGDVEAWGCVFLVDPDGSRVAMVRVDKLGLYGEQYPEPGESANGAKFAFCGVVDLGRVTCVMPDRDDHFCLSVQQDVDELRVKRLETNRPLRVLDGTRHGGSYSLKRLVIDELVAPTLGDQWLHGFERVGAVYVGGKPWRPAA